MMKSCILFSVEIGFHSFAKTKPTRDEFAISFSKEETPTSLSAKEKKHELDNRVGDWEIEEKVEHYVSFEKNFRDCEVE